MNSKNTVLTIPEAAARLRINARRVRALIQAGRLEAVAISPRCRRIRPEAIEAFLTANPWKRDYLAELDREQGGKP